MIERIDSLALMLTGECNLRCGYCYVRNRIRGRMNGDTLRAAIDMALGTSNPQVTILFTGGEPMLALPLIRAAIAYVEANRPPEKRVRLGLITNGILLSPRAVSLLAAHDVEVQLSFDGVPAAQAYRGESTFPLLNRRLEQIRRCHPDFFRQKLSVSITVFPSNLAFLGDSVDYFLKMGIRKIGISPSIIDDGGWRPELFPAIEAQLSRVFDSSVDHLDRHGEVPVTIFRPPENRGPLHADGEMCDLAMGETLAVDPSGRMSACVLFAEMSLPQAAPLTPRLSGLQLGDIRSAALGEMHARLSGACRDAEIFSRREEKRSSFGRCGDCPYFDECAVCPAAIANLAGNADPDRIPDFYCAFNRAALSCQRRFPRKTGLLDLMEEMYNGRGGGNASRWASALSEGSQS